VSAQELIETLGMRAIPYEYCPGDFAILSRDGTHLGLVIGGTEKTLTAEGAVRCFAESSVAHNQWQELIERVSA